jgi:hypothetical protein
MRIRTIKPEFWEHPVMGRKSDATKLLAIGLLNVADDEGYFYADAKLIRNAIRPFDDESRITTVSIRDLSEIGYISIRKHPTHGDIGKVVAFADHQVINKPKRSKLRELYEYGIDTVSIPDESRLEGKGKEGNGREGNGKELLSDFGREEPSFVNLLPPPLATPDRTKTSLEEVLEYGKTLDPPFKSAEKFIAFYDSKGWLIGKSPMKDWRATVRTWQLKDKTTTATKHRPIYEEFTYQKNGTSTHRPLYD